MSQGWAVEKPVGLCEAKRTGRESSQQPTRETATGGAPIFVLGYGVDSSVLLIAIHINVIFLHIDDYLGRSLGEN